MEQAEQDFQERPGRAGLPEQELLGKAARQDCLDKTARTGQKGEGQEKTVRTGHLEQDSYNETARMGQPIPDSKNSASRTGQTEEDCQHMTFMKVLQ
jgi:hypothetical protein